MDSRRYVRLTSRLWTDSRALELAPVARLVLLYRLTLDQRVTAEGLAEDTGCTVAEAAASLELLESEGYLR